MNTYKKQISDINKIARHFALKGYHLTTSFYSQYERCEATIFFHNLHLKERIESELRKYADPDDLVTFQAFDRDNETRIFYTYKIEKRLQ